MEYENHFEILLACQVFSKMKIIYYLSFSPQIQCFCIRLNVEALELDYIEFMSLWSKVDASNFNFFDHVNYKRKELKPFKVERF